MLKKIAITTAMYNIETTDKNNCHDSYKKQDFACIIYLVMFPS